ncbi:hypothetical protein R3P38DRAFT_3201186 [Favolaschia claudopus]|uniref:Uncharacterized protein n=1 Tax=Favolaschia claudopus TaxID=2862362 RepID=A0AAW0AVQ1_9AGAR
MTKAGRSFAGGVLRTVPPFHVGVKGGVEADTWGVWSSSGCGRRVRLYASCFAQAATPRLALAVANSSYSRLSLARTFRCKMQAATCPSSPYPHQKDSAPESIFAWCKDRTIPPSAGATALEDVSLTAHKTSLFTAGRGGYGIDRSSTRDEEDLESQMHNDGAAPAWILRPFTVDGGWAECRSLRHFEDEQSIGQVEGCE